MAIQVPLNPQLQNATQLTQQIQNAVNAVKLNLGGAGGGRALNSLSQPLGRLTGQADEFTKSLDAANARVLAFGASVGVVNALTNAFKAMIVTTINVEKTLTDINVVFGKSSAEIKNFGKGIFDVAKQTGQSFEEVSKAALEFSRQGLTIEDTLARTKDALVLTRLTGLDTAKAVQGLTATINSFSKEALTSSEIINKLASVDQKFSVSAADLTEALSRSASVAQNAGVSFDELIGIVTSLQERTARGGAVIGNSIKTIFTRIQRPEVLKDLKDLGVAVKDVKTEKLLSASEILKNLAGNIGALGQIQKSGIFEEVAGGFQINQLQALLTDLAGAQSTASKAQQVSTAATNEAYTANERLNQTISALINNSVEGLKELGATLGDLGISDSIKSALGVVNGFIESVQNLMEGDGPGAKFAQGIVKGIGSVLSGPGLALFGVIISKLIIDLGKFAVQGLKTFLGIGKAAAEQKALQEAIVITLSRNSNLQAQINKFQGDSVAQAAILAGIYNQQEAALKRQASIAAGMASQLYGAGMRAGPQGFTQTGRRAAGGYLPSAEASDVSRGVGGASPSAQVVSIPNFAFGNGQRGTMIANTSEYIVPNFANGGSAIFNQDMISSMGLPAGAQKIRAAGGYIPNFAKPLVIDAQKDLGGIGMITIGGDPNEKGNAAYNFSYQRSGISANKINNLKNSSYAKDSSPIHVINMIGSKGLTALGEGSSEDKRSAFSSKLNSKIIPSIVDLSRDLFKNYFDVPNLAPITSKPILSPSVEGTIFQEVVAIAADAFRKDGQSTAFQGEDNRPFDYNPQVPADPRLQKLFFDNFNVEKADAKRTDNNESRESMVKKIFNDAYIFKKLLSNRPDIKNEIGENLTLNAGSKREKSITKSAFLEQNASKGYVPNFANKALTDSINRERVQSGLPISAISVTQDNSLINSRNPTGLAVINSRDEPNGKIPNFAAPSPIDRSALVLPPSLMPHLKQFADLIDSLNKQIAKGKITQENATKELEKFVSGVRVGNRTLNPTKGKGLDAVQAGRSQLVNPEKVAQGFGDAAGKIFLFQTALSFTTGAMGDLDSAAGKFTQKIAEATTNITSLAIFGKEIAGIDAKGALAKFGKSLGLLGVGIGIASEGFKAIQYGINEYTGENAKATISLAKLSDATAKATEFLSQLSNASQTKIKSDVEDVFGTAGLTNPIQDFLNKFLEKNVSNAPPEIIKAATSLGAVGMTPGELRDIIEPVMPQQNTNESLVDRLKSIFNTNSRNVNYSTISDVLDKSAGTGLGSELIAKMNQFKLKLPNIDINKPEAVKALKKEVYGENIPTERGELLNEIIAQQQKINSAKKIEAEENRNIALGDQLNLDIAKLEVNTLLERKKLEIDRVSAQQASIEQILKTKPLTISETIEYEKQLELIKIKKTEQEGYLSSIGSFIDKLMSLPDNSLGISKERLEAIAKILNNLNLKNIEDARKAVRDISGQFNLNPTQQSNLLKYFDVDLNKTKTLANEQTRQAKQQALREELIRNYKGTFSEGMDKGMNTLEQKALNFKFTLGEEIPQLFSSNLAQGLNDAISGAKSLKDALTDAATSFFKAITQQNISNLANMFTIKMRSFLPESKIPIEAANKASGGMIKGGSGTKDDIPAMLMGGEYVLKKSAVQKYGSNFLDSLNKGKISGYAAGGGVQSGSGGFYVPGEYGQGAITGKKQLLDFATQNSTSGQFDQMGSYGMTGASINLEGESGRLTMAGRENSPMFERVQQAKEEAFQVYLQSLKVDEQYQNQLKEIKDASKARKKQLLTSISTAIVSSAMNYGFSKSFKNVPKGASSVGKVEEIASTSILPTNYSSGIANTGGGRLFPLDYTRPISQTQLLLNNLNTSANYQVGSRSNNPLFPTNIKRQGFPGYAGYANGGPIFGGSGVRDDVPAMLTGGEFVLNNRATKKLGMSNLQRLNSGDTGSQQGSSDLTQALISKLDELISVTEKTGGDSVVVNVSGAEAQGEKTDGAKSSNERDLQRKIKAAVLEVITQEKRLGGSLNK